MQLIAELCLPTERGGMNSILSLAGKDLIYGKRNNRYGWIGKTIKLTENGAIVLFRNGKEQSYSIDTFVQTFCPAHWSKNQGFRVEALAMAANHVSHNPQPQQQTMDITDLGEFYVWRVNGGMPTKAHMSLSLATEEASRLAKQHPNDEFLVLSVAATVCYKERTHYDLQVSIR